MANAIYPSAKEGFLGADIDLMADDIRVVMVDLADYTYNAAHDFLNDVPSGARVGSATALTGKSITGGVFDADDTTIVGVAGDQTEALIIYKHTGTESTSPVIAFYDNAQVVVLPNGGDVVVQWDNGANKIFKL